MQERKLNRCSEFDYSAEGFYFVTICVQNFVPYFGEVKKGRMILNQYGRIALKFWREIPKHYLGVGIDEFIIMPNHIHGIIVINNDNNVGTGQRPVPTGRYGLLSKIINAFKNMTTKYIRYKMGNKNFVWQRSFYDRVVRDQRALDNIRSYICFNPMQWDGDRSDS